MSRYHGVGMRFLFGPCFWFATWLHQLILSWTITNVLCIYCLLRECMWWSIVFYESLWHNHLATCYSTLGLSTFLCCKSVSILCTHWISWGIIHSLFISDDPLSTSPSQDFSLEKQKILLHYWGIETQVVHSPPPSNVICFSFHCKFHG